MRSPLLRGATSAPSRVAWRCIAASGAPWRRRGQRHRRRSPSGAASSVGVAERAWMRTGQPAAGPTAHCAGMRSRSVSSARPSAPSRAARTASPSATPTSASMPSRRLSRCLRSHAVGRRAGPRRWRRTARCGYIRCSAASVRSRADSLATWVRRRHAARTTGLWHRHVSRRAFRHGPHTWRLGMIGLCCSMARSGCKLSATRRALPRPRVFFFDKKISGRVDGERRRGACRSHGRLKGGRRVVETFSKSSVGVRRRHAAERTMPRSKKKDDAALRLRRRGGCVGGGRRTSTSL